MLGTGHWTGSVARPQYDRIDSYEGSSYVGAAGYVRSADGR